MSIHDFSGATSDSTTDAYTDARQAEYVAFLHRVPFAIDALNLGFLTGFREDCSYQQRQFLNLDLPVGMLDNDFRNPDLDRYTERVLEHGPDVGIIGDAYDRAEAQSYVRAVRDLQKRVPDTEFVIVPKCKAALEVIPDDIVVGYSRGYADILAHDFSDPVDWRGRRVHILGGSPPKQLAVIDQLTQPTLTGDPPADIVGLDWNGLHRGAQFGEFWTDNGWDDSGRDADHMTVRATVRHGLGHVRSFWENQGVWPEGPTEYTGRTQYQPPTPADLHSSTCVECEDDVWTGSRDPFVAEYDTGDVCGYCCYDCYFTHRTQNHLEEVMGEASVYFPPASR